MGSPSRMAATTRICYNHGGYTGGVYLLRGWADVTGNLFKGDSASGTSTSGTGYYGGAISARIVTGSALSLTVANNVFVNNSAYGGAAMAVTGGSLTLVNNTFLANVPTNYGTL